MDPEIRNAGGPRAGSCVRNAKRSKPVARDMRNASLLLFAALLLAPGGVPTANAAEGAAAASAATQLAKDLEGPVDLAFGADGTLYYAELRTGNVRSLSGAGDVSEPLATVPSSPGGNGGFIGLATDPDSPRVVYAYYSMNASEASSGKINRVVRLDLDAGTETVLLDDLRWTEFHDGGRLAVGPDGYLYVTTGDNGRPDLRAGDHGDDYPSQDPADVRGKILRIDRETGEAAPDNPGGDENPLVYARGFRNPFGIHVLDDGRVFVSDNGPTSGDEVNLVEPGGNHGWPYCAGPCDRDGMVDPIASWSPAFGPTGIAVKDEVVYVGDFNNGQIRTVDVASGETGVFWESKAGPVLDVELGPDGCLYASTFTAIWRLGAAYGTACAGETPDEPDESTTPTTPTPPTGDGGTGATPPPLTQPSDDVDRGASDIPGPGALAALGVGLSAARMLRPRRPGRSP
jgi:glucose/arabinose dehydrogenase